MNCLIEIYNNDQISNLTIIFSLKPKEVILLYDENHTNKKNMNFFKEACLNKIPNIKFEFIQFDNTNIDKIYSICSDLIHKNQKCFFDITGADELGAIGAYLACKKTFTPIFKIDIIDNKLINIYGCNSLEKNFIAPKFTMDTIFALRGASIVGNNHKTPEKSLYDNILKFCDVIFNRLDEWKNLCYYLQTGSAKYPQSAKSNLFWAPRILKNNKNKIYLSSDYILYEAEKFKLINNLDICDSNISFEFKNREIKRYLTDFGVWLELYCFIKLKQCSLFHDVRLSVKLDWNNSKDRSLEVMNEIDVTFFYKTRPCFISCKLSEPSSDTLQELSMYPNFLGGKNSKPFLAILSTINKKDSYVYKRAKTINITVIDGNDIKNNTFLKHIKNSLNIENNS